MTELINEKSTLLKVCFLIIEIVSALGFLLFLVTGITSKINAGNIAGAFISAAVFLLSVKRSEVSALITAMKQTTGGRVILTAIAAAAAICIAAAIILSVLMIIHINRLPDKPAAVIVLGCRVKESGPSLMLENRIQAAYDYLSEHENVICIASGGKGSDEPISEAKCIRDRLVEMGISPDRIVLEDKSTNTSENISNSMEIMNQLGLGSEAVIITSEFHQLRAHIMASRRGMTAYSKSASTFLPLLPSYWIREWFGIVYELVFG